MLDAKEYLESIKHFVDYSDDALEILQNDPIYLPLLKLSVEGYKEVLKTEAPNLVLRFITHADLVTPHKYVMHLSKKDKKLRDFLKEDVRLDIYRKLRNSNLTQYLDYVDFSLHYNHELGLNSKNLYSKKAVIFPIQLNLYFTPEDLYYILKQKEWEYEENVNSDSHVFSLDENTISFPKVLKTNEDCVKLKDTLSYLQSFYSTDFIQSYNFTECEYMHSILRELLSNYDFKKRFPDLKEESVK